MIPRSRSSRQHDALSCLVSTVFVSVLDRLLVQGYSSKPDMAVITNMLHSVDAALRVDCYYEWVPSAANIADIPSRDPRTRTSTCVGIMARLGATRRALRLPLQVQWRDLTLLLDARSAISGAATCPLPAR